MIDFVKSLWQVNGTQIVWLTRSKVKVKVMARLKFRKLPKIALFYVYLIRDFGMELKSNGWSY